MMKKIASALLVLCLLLGTIPPRIFAAGVPPELSEFAVAIADERSASNAAVTREVNIPNTPPDDNVSAGDAPAVKDAETFTGAASDKTARLFADDYSLIFGDVNGDGALTEDDVTVLTEAYMDKSGEKTLTDRQAYAADLTGDGEIGLGDVMALGDYVHGDSELSDLPGTANLIAQGYCGEDGMNLMWSLDKNGTLTISGSGAMCDSPSWNDARNNGINYKDQITGVVIENGVTTIGNSAFRYCYALTSVTIPSSVTSIGNSAFADCSALTSVNIPNGVTSIGNYAFEDCSNLASVTIPNSVTSIGNSAFEGCSNLTSVTIPNSVMTIGNGAFRYCYALTSINVESENTQYSSENGVLFDKTKTHLIQYPAQKTDTTYTIPNSVTTIGDHAFHACTALTSVEIPDSVTSIEEYAFADCYSLTSITIPKSVTFLGDCAAAECMKFEYTNLTEVLVEDGNPSYVSQNGVLFNREKTQILRYPAGKAGVGYTIPNGVISIEDHTFCCCEQLTWIAIPDSVTSIGRLAFYDNDSLTDIYYAGTENEWNNISIRAVIPDSTVIHYDSPSPEPDIDPYRILEGIPDMTGYSAQTWHLAGNLSEFHALSIDGTNLTLNADFTVTEGSTLLRIPAETFERFGMGTHTIAAEFVTADRTPRRVSQEYTVQPPNEIQIATDILSDGVLYVPYSSLIETMGNYLNAQIAFVVTSGQLPPGITLTSSGELYGTPQKVGEFAFTVTVTGTFSDGGNAISDSKEYTLFVTENRDYFVSNATDESCKITVYVPNMLLSSETISSTTDFWDGVELLDGYRDVMFGAEGNPDDFVNLWLDGRALIRDTDYTLVSDISATSIRIFAMTLQSAGKGRHTLSAEFRVGGEDGVLVRAAQNYTVNLIGDIDASEIVDGVKHVPYTGRLQFNALQDSDAVTYELVSGNLPDGLQLEPDGQISGLPTTPGEYVFTVKASGGDYYGEAECHVTIRDNTNLNVRHEISPEHETINPLPDKIYSDSTYTFSFKGDIDNFVALYIKGIELTRQVDYTLQAISDAASLTGVDAQAGLFAGGTGSGVSVTVNPSAIQKAGTGVVTVAGKFVENDATTVYAENVDVVPAPTSPRPSGGGGSGSSGGSSSGSGGGSGSSSNYTITVMKTLHGSVSVKPKSAKKGATVNVSVTPDKGYELLALNVVDSKNTPIPTTKTADGFSFTMPKSSVSVTATFKSIEQGSTDPGGLQGIINPPVPVEKSPFSDVRISALLYNDIKWANEKKLMMGYDDGTYRPNNPVSSVTTVVVLARMTDPSLRNATTGVWYRNYENWAKSNRILPSGIQMGNDAFSRGEMARLLVSYLKARGKDCTPTTRVKFVDSDRMLPQEEEAFQYLYSIGVFTGTNKLQMTPRGHLTRAQLAALIHRLYSFIG